MYLKHSRITSRVSLLQEAAAAGSPGAGSPGAASPGAATPAAAQDEDDEFNPQAYYENRTKAVLKLAADGVNPYPHKFHTNMSIPAFVQKYTSLGNEVRGDNSFPRD